MNPHYVSCFPMHKEEAIFKVRVAISEGARCGSYVALATLRIARNVSCKQVFRAHCSQVWSPISVFGHQLRWKSQQAFFFFPKTFSNRISICNHRNQLDPSGFAWGELVKDRTFKMARCGEQMSDFAECFRPKFRTSWCTSAVRSRWNHSHELITAQVQLQSQTGRRFLISTLPKDLTMPCKCIVRLGILAEYLLLRAI